MSSRAAAHWINKWGGRVAISWRDCFGRWDQQDRPRKDKKDYMADQPQQQNMNVKITDEILKGVYANMMMVAHTKEEFVLDFMNMFPPSGIINSRVITSPGHLKRIVAALADNIKKYEAQFGPIKQSNNQAPTQTASSTSEKSFGFETK